MGGQVNCRLPSGLSPGSEGKWQGQVNWPMKYSCDKQQWYLNAFLLGVKL
jgi:hypothetical protein